MVWVTSNSILFKTQIVPSSKIQSCDPMARNYITKLLTSISWVNIIYELVLLHRTQSHKVQNQYYLQKVIFGKPHAKSTIQFLLQGLVILWYLIKVTNTILIYSITLIPWQNHASAHCVRDLPLVETTKLCRTWITSWIGLAVSWDCAHVLIML